MCINNNKIVVISGKQKDEKVIIQAWSSYNASKATDSWAYM